MTNWKCSTRLSLCSLFVMARRERIIEKRAKLTKLRPKMLHFLIFTGIFYSRGGGIKLTSGNLATHKFGANEQMQANEMKNIFIYSPLS